MAYYDICILESDAPGLTGDEYDIVALLGRPGEIGAVVANAFGMAADMEEVVSRIRRPINRLLVAVPDHDDPNAVGRVRNALRWSNRVPF